MSVVNFPISAHLPRVVQRGQALRRCGNVELFQSADGV